MRRFPMIDLLRFVAASLVLLSHVAFWTAASGTDTSGPLLARGDSGVAVFFAISAFLLVAPWLRGTPDLRRYAVHRVARIMPAYWLALVAVLLVELLAGRSLEPGTVLAHVVLVQGFTGHTFTSFTQTWSLTTEVSFYLLLPLLGPALRRALDRSVPHALGTLAAVTTLGVVAQVVAAAGTHAGASWWPGVLATSAVGHAGWFAVGGALAVLHTCEGRAWLAGTGRDLPRPTLLVGAAVVVYLVAALPIAGPVGLEAPTLAQAAVKEALYLVLAGLLLAAAVAPAHDDAHRALERTPLGRRLGDLSYAVFLWHVPMLQFLYTISGWPLFRGGFGAMLFAVVVFTGLAAVASFTLVERPVLERFAGRRRATTSTTARG